MGIYRLRIPCMNVTQHRDGHMLCFVLDFKDLYRGLGLQDVRRLYIKSYARTILFIFIVCVANMQYINPICIHAKVKRVCRRSHHIFW